MFQLAGMKICVLDKAKRFTGLCLNLFLPRILPMSKKTLVEKANEKVLVVPRSKIFAGETWHGIRSENPAKYLKLILANYTFLPRGEVENDHSWQQIIPYLVLGWGGKIFLMKRKGDHTESRLSGMYSIGVGGHVNKEDVRGLGRLSST